MSLSETENISQAMYILLLELFKGEIKWKKITLHKGLRWKYQSIG